MTIYDDFLRGNPASTRGETAKAAFAPLDAVAATPGLQFEPKRNAQAKLFLGVHDATVKEHVLPDGRTERYAIGGRPIGVGDDRHIITIAGTRAGKGRAMIVPNLITYPGSMLVIDPKGDLARITAATRARDLGHKVHVLDPFGSAGNVGRHFPGSFNPLSILTPTSKTAVEDAGLIADALIVPSDRDAHWDESARMWVETVILHVATSAQFEGRRDLLSVAGVIDRALKPDSQDKEKYELEIELERNNKWHDGVISAGGRAFYDRSERELESVQSTTRRHLHFLEYNQMKPVLQQGPAAVDLGGMKRHPTTVYLTLPALRMGTCSRWLRLFVNLILAAMEDERTKPRHPVLLCLDEFAVLGRMKTIEDAAGQIAGLGCKLWPILQDLGQLKALYGDRWETFMGNAGVLQFFGNSDMTTLEWISQRLGQTTVSSLSQSEVSYDTKKATGTTGHGWSQSTQPLMTAEEAARFFGRDDAHLRQLIIRPSFPPVVLQRAYYDKHELFRGRYALED